MTRALIVCPGRGSYTSESLGSLPPGNDRVQRADDLRREYGLPTLTELDGAESFSPGTHLSPANASALIWLVSVLDAGAALAEHEVVAVCGNSMGWYTSLVVAGALSFDDGFRLVQEMALLQEEHTAGGQIIYPVIGADWCRDPELEEAVRSAVEASDGSALRSIRLGGYEVLAGTETGIAHLNRVLPQVRLGKNVYPFRLVKHGPYHTPLLEDVSVRAREKLAHLDFSAPEITLIDGRGSRYSPWSTDVDALREYTVGAQVTETYDFTSSVRVALREYAPDVVVLPGPGNSLGGVVAQILITEGYRGVHSREDFERAQKSTEAPVVSMRR